MRHLRVVLVLLKGADTEFDRIFVKEDIILNDDESIIMFRTVIYRANDIPLETKTCLANENFRETVPVCLSKGDHLFILGVAPSGSVYKQYCVKVMVVCFKGIKDFGKMVMPVESHQAYANAKCFFRGVLEHNS